MCVGNASRRYKCEQSYLPALSLRYKGGEGGRSKEASFLNPRARVGSWAFSIMYPGNASPIMIARKEKKIV